MYSDRVLGLRSRANVSVVSLKPVHDSRNKQKWVVACPRIGRSHGAKMWENGVILSLMGVTCGHVFL